MPVAPVPAGADQIDMTPFLRKLLGLNWLLLLVMLALAVFGVIAIYSATYMREDPVAADFWRKQANWVVVGFFAFMVASLVELSMDSVGCPADVSGRYLLFSPDQVHGAKGLRRAELAPSRSD